jgi:hypothetical protein
VYFCMSKRSARIPGADQNFHQPEGCSRARDILRRELTSPLHRFHPITALLGRCAEPFESTGCGQSPSIPFG